MRLDWTDKQTDRRDRKQYHAALTGDDNDHNMDGVKHNTTLI